MNLGVLLRNLVLGPAELLLESFFALINRALNPGLSLVLLSLAAAVLALPLYRGLSRPESSGKSLSKLALSLLPLAAHLLLLAAAARFLPRLGVLAGASLGPLRDLSQPDALLPLGGFALNLLPIAMLAIGLSAAISNFRRPFSAAGALRIVSALAIPVLTYSSPAGLTLFWTLYLGFSAGIDLIRRLLCRRKPEQKKHPLPRLLRGAPRPGLFFLFALLLSLLTGLLIPSSVLVVSPQEFVDDIQDLHPVWYAVNAFLLALGAFVLWGGAFYVLGSGPVRKGMEAGALVLFGIFLINYFFFRGGLGTMSSALVYDQPPVFTPVQMLINLAVLAAAAAALLWGLIRAEDLIRPIAWILAAVMLGLSGWNLWNVRQEAAEAYRVQARNHEGAAEIPLSRNGKNVIVLMLDRAIGSYLPCILQERPELAEVFSGFVYYPNTLSFGVHTNLAAPALFGGYEYTPLAMNRRDTELLKDKHNEALLLMPTLFSREGYQVTVFDVPYPGNYSESGDYTLFDHLPNTNARIIHGENSGNGRWTRAEDLRLRNFFCYSLTTCMPTAMYGTLYNMGNYNRAEQTPVLLVSKPIPPVYGDLEVSPSFMVEYEVMQQLPRMTLAREEGNTMLMMVNNLTHNPVLLSEPEYVPGSSVDNTAYDSAHADRFLAGPLPLTAETDVQMAHYQVNMAALTMVGNWLQEMKTLGVYDQTRIIICADHGFWLRQIPEGILASGEDIMGYNPLLMVKDFGAEGPVRTDSAFMTNADVPTLALKDLMESPVNPFTGKPIGNSEKQEPLHVTSSREYEVGSKIGTTFKPGEWYTVSPEGETLFDLSRWTEEAGMH